MVSSCFSGEKLMCGFKMQALLNVGKAQFPAASDKMSKWICVIC